MTAASKANRNVRSTPQQASSYRVRTIKPPAKPGTIKQSVIRKAVKEIMAERANA